MKWSTIAKSKKKAAKNAQAPFSERVKNSHEIPVAKKKTKSGYVIHGYRTKWKHTVNDLFLFNFYLFFRKACCWWKKNKITRGCFCGGRHEQSIYHPLTRQSFASVYYWIKDLEKINRCLWKKNILIMF